MEDKCIPFKNTVKSKKKCHKEAKEEHQLTLKQCRMQFQNR